MKKTKIKKCCASCRHKMIDEEGGRVCLLMQLMVKQQFKCHKWHMAKALCKAGRSQGMIKRREYLMYVLEVRMQGCDETPDSLRKRFEAETGLSPFLIY